MDMKTNEQTHIKTLDGTVHSATYVQRKFHGHLTGTIASPVLVTKCGVAATGSTTTDKVTCESC